MITSSPSSISQLLSLDRARCPLSEYAKHSIMCTTQTREIDVLHEEVNVNDQEARQTVKSDHVGRGHSYRSVHA